MSPTLAMSYSEHDYDPNHPPRNEYHSSTAAPPYGADTISPPALHHFETTPGGSSSALSCCSDLDEDPFLGAELGDSHGQPSSFDDNFDFKPIYVAPNISNGTQSAQDAIESPYPLTPDPTVSIHAASPHSELRAATRHHHTHPPPSISPQELQKPWKPEKIIERPTQLTPSQSSSARTSEDGLAPARMNMPATSPKLVISVWDHEKAVATETVESHFKDDESITTAGGVQSAGDLIASNATRDAEGMWQRDPSTGHGGIDPRHRDSEETEKNIQELAKARERDQRKDEVGQWLSANLDETSAPREEQDSRAIEEENRNSQDQVPMGQGTENWFIPGQTYFSGVGGQMTQEDEDILAADRNWGDAPIIHRILDGRKPGQTQPVSSAAAMARFERLCRDNDSILSRQATWGTRRRSFHSTASVDMEGVLSGNLFKKLSLTKTPEKTSKATEILRDIRGFVRRPSISGLRKRRSSNASNVSDDGREEQPPPLVKHDSTGSPHLAPPDRTSSWGKNKTPSINTAIMSMGTGAAAVGTHHARKASVGATSPRGFLSSLQVDNPLKRARSRSEVPRPTSASNLDTSPGLADLWKANGGVPVTSVRQTAPPQQDLDDEDEDDEDADDPSLEGEANQIDTVTPNLTGFQQHVLALNPYMQGRFEYLVDRIAHQQVVRYKSLLILKVKHLSMGANCANGGLCMTHGGQAKLLEPKTGAKATDALAMHFQDDEGENAPVEGQFNQDSFPKGIPMPPAQQLPAEFECRLCFTQKKFNKPSDWTKHVHEDVMPFTCTWDKCRDAKSFKRKADWVRHENEGHRHLDSWRCNVDDCSHTCYRRDNFLQHLVREHKFAEPKLKTKTAIKKAFGTDPTWQKVEECHISSQNRPQDEPCRFCGKTFPTWKKLTVHLAKHMEHIALPVLRLVAARAEEISADTIISPVQDPPVRTYPVVNPNDPFPPVNHHHDMSQMLANSSFQDTGYQMYPNVPPGHQHNQQHHFYNAQYNAMAQRYQQPTLGLDSTMSQGFNGQIQTMPATSAPYGPTTQYMTASNNGHGFDSGMEPFPDLSNDLSDGLGLQDENQMGSSLGFNHMMDPSTASASPYSGHSSQSPFVRSPHMGADNYNNNHWNNQHMHQFQ
ncbi:uncharacterized protein J7T54_005927 [Emericellopsis cladophorae]|uniref:C2H2-type domain-containing protein n=1 Tax=Emericellopsis cladophorae TaxID=2686198 RepID=A0A9P9Y8L0_9HYPO|nr:uncharacterized protein J7T54_005927 [Emericellopsis cladophorae]KAI6785593.1 hypothetical protein J7T54_005927 [Emericellopsis cladophorae]